MINSTQSPQGTQPNQTRPAFAPSYNAVQINLDTPTLNAPPAGYYYDYPQAEGQPYYPPAQPMPQQPTAPAVPTPVPEAPVNNAPTEQPALTEDNTAQVLANLSDPDYDKQFAQLKEIGDLSRTDEAKVIPYIKKDIMNKILDIISVDSSNLEAPTERQLQLRQLVAQNDAVIEQAKEQGIDLNTVQLPNQISPEDDALARTLTAQDKAEQNKVYALYALSGLQKGFVDITERNKNAVPALTDVPGIAQMVEEIKNNPNAAVRIAALDSLHYLVRPEYANDIATVYQIAQSDEDPSVANSAALLLNDLAVSQQAAQPQEQQAQPQPAQA